METVFDPRLGVMVDRRTGLPVSGNATPPQSVNVLAQMLNGTGIPERVSALNSLFNPVVALGEAGQHSQNMLAPGRAPMQRVSDAGQMLTGMAGTVVPMWAASRGAVPTTNALVDAMTGINLPGGEFLVDEFGGVRLPGGGIRAYHGSPHSFDKFSMDKIGTGEGAQAYGHGLYFAENEAVARSYRDALANKKYMPGNTSSPLKTAWSLIGGSAENAAMPTDNLLKYVKSAWPDVPDNELRAAIDEAKSQFSPGRMYEVQINADPEAFLDWDKPLSEQPQAVRDVLGKFGANPDEPGQVAFGRVGRDTFPIKGPDGRWGPGGATYEESLALVGGDKAKVLRARSGDPASRAAVAKDQGIPGIKYLDAGSRGVGDGSRNYVVFDDALIEILRKYGIAGAAAMLGVSAADVEQAMAGER